MALETAMADYLVFLERVRGCSPATIRSYAQVFAEAAPRIVVEEGDDAIFVDMMPYRMTIAAQGKRTIARKVSALRSLWGYMRDRGPALTVKGDDQVKLPVLLPKPVATESVTAVLEELDTQERMLVLLLYGAGLRIAEAAGLRRSDIGTSWLTVLGKGGKTRQVPIIPPLREIFDTLETGEYLFESRGRKLSENSLRYKITKIFHKTGKHVTPHQLRHAFATDLLNGGARINDVSELLGHRHLSTTQIYTKLSSAAKMTNYRNAHPLCRDAGEDGEGA